MHMYMNNMHRQIQVHKHIFGHVPISEYTYYIYNIYIYIYIYIHIHICICIRIRIRIHIHIYIYIYDAGLPHPPPPPAPWYPPLLVKWVVVLFGLVAFPVWSFLASSPPPPCGVGPVVFLVGPAPPVGGSVFYRDMVWLLPPVSSNVIVMLVVMSS